jgi:hypothetical protein
VVAFGAFGAFGQHGQQCFVTTYRDDPNWSVADRLSAAPARLLDVVAAFGLACPAPDVGLGDGLALARLTNGSVLAILGGDRRPTEAGAGGPGLGRQFRLQRVFVYAE